MSQIDEYDQKLLAQHELCERFGAGGPLTDEEMTVIMGIDGARYYAYRERRLQALLEKQKG
jgi:hypothetical protein